MKTEPEHVAADGTVRKDHYGAGRQPWDDIVDEAWAPEFAAGNALKYVRRHKAKNGEDDLAKGRWYYERLVAMAKGTGSLPSRGEAWLPKAIQSRSITVLKRLQAMLTDEERDALRKGAII